MAYTTIKTHEHTQSTPSNTWIIDHTLGYYPIVEIFVNNDGKLVKIMPLDVEQVSISQVKVTFSGNFTGFARLA